MTPIPEATSTVPPTDTSNNYSPNSNGAVQDPPPKYGSYEAHPEPTAVQEHHYTAHVQRRRSSPMRRFCAAFAVAVLTWVLITALVQSMMVIAHYGAQFVSLNTNEWPSDEEFPIPPDLERVRCAWGDEIAEHTKLRASLKQVLRAPLTFPFKVQERFELAVDADNLFFLSRGIYSGGRIKVKRSSKAGDVAKVKVRLEYLRPGTPRIAKVCEFRRGDKEVGLGVFTPGEPKYAHHHLAFYITVTLPKSNTSDYLHIKKFETDMPNFTQLLGRLGNDVFFDDISLKSANGGIIARSIAAERGSVETTNGPVHFHHGEFGSLDVSSRNGPIQGVFNATGSLVLKTSNSGITGKVLINTGDNGAAKLELYTTHSLIDTQVWLKNHGEEKGGHFDVVATTDRGPIKLKFVDAPVDSKLKLTAKSTDGPAIVVLHPTYEGEFELVSAPLPGKVLVRPKVRDPSGQDRERRVEIVREGNRVTGDVNWSDEGKENGHVHIETTHSPAVLRL